MAKRLLVICEGYEAWRSSVIDADTGEMIRGAVMRFDAHVDVAADVPRVELFLDAAGDLAPFDDVEEIEFRIVKTRTFNLWTLRNDPSLPPAQAPRSA